MSISFSHVRTSATSMFNLGGVYRYLILDSLIRVPSPHIKQAKQRAPLLGNSQPHAEKCSQAS